MDGRQRGKTLEENERKRRACLATFFLPIFPWKRKFCAPGVHFYRTLEILAKIKMQMEKLMIFFLKKTDLPDVS